MKRYRDYNTYLKEIFGERVQKISLDAGLGCPNRDGTLSDRGCSFCDPLGSGTGAYLLNGQSIPAQIIQGRKVLQTRYGAKKFIAYFQSFTNTYAPIDHLKSLYEQALEPPDVVGLSVATRPDCLNEEVLKLLCSYGKRYLLWLELGLQSAHNETLKRINRGHDVACFERAVLRAADYGLQVCAHVILGLPGEDHEMMRQTARYLSHLPIHGIKVHLLYVIKGTPLAELYLKKGLQCLSREEYTELVIDFLELLPPDVVIQRLTGDPGPAELLAPQWAKEKAKNLALIRKRMEERDTWQGRLYPGPTVGNGLSMD